MNGWPDIPGGWTDEAVCIAGVEFRIRRPADPDAFLDDPGVIQANLANDYMPYWGFIWPSAIAMTEWIVKQDWRPAHLLEIGCGVGLTGLAALSRGHRVTFSDHDQQAVEAACRNAELNGFDNHDGVVADWRSPGTQRFETVIANDVLYEQTLHSILIEFLEAVVARQGTAWFGDPGRERAAEFMTLARERGWRTIRYGFNDTHQLPETAGVWQLSRIGEGLKTGD